MSTEFATSSVQLKISVLPEEGKDLPKKLRELANLVEELLAKGYNLDTSFSTFSRMTKEEPI